MAFVSGALPASASASASLSQSTAVCRRPAAGPSRIARAPGTSSALRLARRSFHGAAVYNAHSASVPSLRSPSVVFCKAGAQEASASEPRTGSVPFPIDFNEICSQIASAVGAALKEGVTYMEVEFPPLPQRILDSTSSSSYQVADATVAHAVSIAKQLKLDGTIKIVYPDEAEKNRAADVVGDRPQPNVELAALTDGFDSQRGTFKLSAETDDAIYFIMTASCQELPDVERFVNERTAGRPVVLFNLKLETLKGDLGLPFFPSKDMQYRFLSKFRAVYYLRYRGYSRSTFKPPYVLNYGGFLFRCFPGGWQVLADNKTATPALVSELPERPNLGVVKRLVQEHLGIGDFESKEKATAVEKGGLAGFISKMREGVKETTWWEDADAKCASREWRL
eukprot:tig00000792_g4173.t1